MNFGQLFCTAWKELLLLNGPESEEGPTIYGICYKCNVEAIYPKYGRVQEGRDDLDRITCI